MDAVLPAGEPVEVEDDDRDGFEVAGTSTSRSGSYSNGVVPTAAWLRAKARSRAADGAADGDDAGDDDGDDEEEDADDDGDSAQIW